MKKSIIVFLAAVLVLAVSVPAVLALSDNRKAELESLYEQENLIRLQILEKQEEFGLLEPEEAESIRDRLEEKWELQKERMAEGDYVFGPGRGGCEGAGGGMMNGMMGSGGMMNGMMGSGGMMW